MGNKRFRHTIHSTSGIRRLALVALLGVLMVSAVAATAARAATSGACWSNPALMCYPKMAVSYTPWLSPWSRGAQYWTIAAGTRVNMRCWTTGATQLGTAKWFHVTSQSYPYTDGYVPANAVTSQIIVGHC